MYKASSLLHILVQNELVEQPLLDAEREGKLIETFVQKVNYANLYTEF